MLNKTRDDAYARVMLARLGSCADEPTLEYLVELRGFIQQWADEVQAAYVKHPDHVRAVAEIDALIDEMEED